jgi:hypothetical protein
MRELRPIIWKIDGDGTAKPGVRIRANYPLSRNWIMPCSNLAKSAYLPDYRNLQICKFYHFFIVMKVFIEVQIFYA